jgi:hypothetical protein
MDTIDENSYRDCRGVHSMRGGVAGQSGRSNAEDLRVHARSAAGGVPGLSFQKVISPNPIAPVHHAVSAVPHDSEEPNR